MKRQFVGHLHRALFGLNLFLAVTAIAGGVGLLTGLIAPGADLLAGSIFSSYVIPGLALLLLVGGAATLATIEVGRGGEYQYVLAVFAGAMMIIFELVEWTVIGYHFLQAIYLGAGGLTIALAIGLLVAPANEAAKRVAGPPETVHRRG